MPVFWVEGPASTLAVRRVPVLQDLGRSLQDSPCQHSGSATLISRLNFSKSSPRSNPKHGLRRALHRDALPENAAQAVAESSGTLAPGLDERIEDVEQALLHLLVCLKELAVVSQVAIDDSH